MEDLREVTEEEGDEVESKETLDFVDEENGGRREGEEEAGVVKQDIVDDNTICSAAIRFLFFLFFLFFLTQQQFEFRPCHTAQDALVHNDGTNCSPWVILYFFSTFQFCFIAQQFQYDLISNQKFL